MNMTLKWHHIKKQAASQLVAQECIDGHSDRGEAKMGHTHSK